MWELGNSEEAVWRSIDVAFARPVHRTDDKNEYFPTQVLAALFRNAGYAGVRFSSSVGPGYNLALFDPGNAECGERCVYEVEKVLVELSRYPGTCID